MENEPVKIEDLMLKALEVPGKLLTGSNQFGMEFSAFFDPSTKIMHTNLPQWKHVVCPFRDRHAANAACEVCGYIEKVNKKVSLDGYGYLYWGNEKLGFISSIFRRGGLLNTAKEEMKKKFEKIEEDGGKVSLRDAERIYEELPKDYK